MRKEEKEDIIEELAMVLCHIDGRYWNDLTLSEASDYKKKTGRVCLKVDKLPEYNNYNDLTRGLDDRVKYVAVESLIKEE